jgi:hypothetical protein
MDFIFIIDTSTAVVIYEEMHYDMMTVRVTNPSVSFKTTQIQHQLKATYLKPGKN